MEQYESVEVGGPAEILHKEDPGKGRPFSRAKDFQRASYLAATWQLMTGPLAGILQACRAFPTTLEAEQCHIIIIIVDAVLYHGHM